ncbi:MAG: hypothetical protein MRECE_34c006 [Mycoplasmataceae bacterium CE_OT135]|nr:MAG: hypothetical protein MRECE_34c006 [Mycoplasmataceae bacterium CE_OT135]
MAQLELYGTKTGAIGGLNLKLEYNVKKGKSINIFILSEENKDTYENINFSLIYKEKIKQVHFVSFTSQIEIALQEILKEPERKVIHSCGKSEVRDKKQKEPEPKTAEVQATPEQLLAYFFDGGWCGISGRQESKTRQTKDDYPSIPPASPLFGSLQNLFSIQYKEVSDKTKNLYEEYKQKLNSNSDLEEWYQNELAKLEKSNSNQNNEDSQEKISEIQGEINTLKTEIKAKREMTEQAKINEQRIIEIEKEIAGHKQAKANEEVILENINRQIEENRQNPNQNLEADKQAVSQRIAELSAKITSSEEEIANLRQNQQESIKEVEELEFQLKDLEEKLQTLLRNQKLPNSSSSRELENKRRQLEQEYQLRKKLDQGEEQIYREYENKFKEIAAPLANLIPEIQKQLAKLGYEKLIIRWKQGEQFGRIHLTTLEPSVIFEVEKN